MAIDFDHKQFLQYLTTEPGVYQMISADGKVLYVGKAKNLKKRVQSYFLKLQSPRISSLVSQICDIKIITTKTEVEALLLESNLIKSLKPRYNILFRDDKSYPYIYLSSNLKFPSLRFHRGAKSKKGRYFGPYPSGTAVRHALNLLQKLFQVRQCSESFFKNRSRPCMQYQIKRCSGPCVNKISKDDYAEAVKNTELFLQGKSKQLLLDFIEKMQKASENLDFEKAALYRDQISSLRHIQEKQTVIMGADDLDILAIAVSGQQACVEVLFVRSGNMIGDHSYFSKIVYEQKPPEILEQFIAQFYLNKKHADDIPKILLLKQEINEQNWIETTLTQIKGQKVTIKTPKVGDKLHWLELAEKNAQQKLMAKLARHSNYQDKFQQLQTVLKLPELPNRIECFDISHTAGEATIASCVVFDLEGKVSQSYRRYNIKNITAGDDYAAMRQALLTRYEKMKKSENPLPSIVLIDGGKGQLKQAESVFEELQLPEIYALGICKGEGRKAEFDRIITSNDYQQIQLNNYSSAMHLLQEIRDEAHRFAISGHTAKRDKKRKSSVLEGIEGIGQKRRQQILNYFGGLQSLKGASAEQIAEVPGISLELAKRIADYLK